MTSVLRSCRRTASAVRAAPLSSLAASLPIVSSRSGAAALSSLASSVAATRKPVFGALARRACFSTQTFERADRTIHEDKEEPRAESAADPETQILQNAIHHVAEHGYAASK